VDDAQIAPRDGEVGIERDRRAQRALGLAQVSAGERDEAEIGVGLGEVGAVLEREAEPRFGLVEAARDEVRRARPIVVERDSRHRETAASN
jgi:hypothetical protein